MLKKIWWWLLVILLVAGDRLSKLWMLNHLDVGMIFSLNRWLNWMLAFNYGGAFSLFASGNGWQNWLFLGATVVATCVILWLRLCQPELNCAKQLALALLLGGALGNAYDRYYYGYVIDFIDVNLWGWHYPTFNVADMEICIGAVLFIWQVCCESKVAGLGVGKK